MVKDYLNFRNGKGSRLKGNWSFNDRVALLVYKNRAFYSSVRSQPLRCTIQSCNQTPWDLPFLAIFSRHVALATSHDPKASGTDLLCYADVGGVITNQAFDDAGIPNSWGWVSPMTNRNTSKFP
jgi:hypothetical protein